MKILAYTLWTLTLLNKILSQTITTVTYTGTVTTIICPAQGSYTLPAWSGPPYPTPAGTIYTVSGLAQFNPNLPQEKLARLRYANNQRDLLLNNTRMYDAGKYICIKVGVFSQAINSLLVRVLSAKPEISTSVTIDNNGVRATEGQSVTITCTSRGGNPAPTVVWYKGSITGQELARTSTGTKEVDGTYTVTLPYAFIPRRQDDRQQLMCRSYYPTPADSQGSKQTAVSLYLYLKPIQPSFPKPFSVVTGGTVNATCTSTGSRPAAAISWTYRGETLTPPVTPLEDQSSQTFTVVSVLQRTVTVTDNGQNVQCSVTHMALTNTLLMSKALEVQFPVEQSTSMIIGNTVIEANGVNQLTLTCTTGSSNPASNITWKKGPDIISNSNVYSNTTGTNNGIVRSQTLTLRPTRYYDGVTISCSVSNGILQVKDTTSTVLKLNYSPLIADMSDTNAVEGDSVTLKCNASSKPVASFTWKKGSTTVAQGTGTASYNGYDNTISTVNRTQAGTYTCTANNHLSQPDSKQTSLTVLYPPDIAVVGVNTTVNSHSTTVTCEAFGVPDQYTYERWVHMWDGQIVTHPVSLPATRVLTLTDLSYAHSGMYTCRASNGVKGVSRGSAGLLVKSSNLKQSEKLQTPVSFPVIVGETAKTKDIKASGSLHQPITALLQYYSNAGSGSVKVYSPTRQEVGHVSYRDVTVILPVFLSQIATQGIEAIISITVLDESQFGTYEVRVTNEIDTVILTLVILALGPPESPFVVNVTVLDHQSVNVTWISGFPNGLNQTFIIQLSTDNSTWQNVSLYGGMSYEQAHWNVIHNLGSSQSYYLRMIATNGKGESRPTDMFYFETEAVSYDPDNQPVTGVIAGGAAGGALMALLVVVGVVYILLRRRRNKLSYDKTKDNRQIDLPSNNNRGKGGRIDGGDTTDTEVDTSSQSYETLKTTQDVRCYDTLRPNSDQPHIYENPERTPYESLRTREDNGTRTYDQLQIEEPRPTIYENLKLTTSV